MGCLRAQHIIINHLTEKTRTQSCTRAQTGSDFKLALQLQQNSNPPPPTQLNLAGPSSSTRQLQGHTPPAAQPFTPTHPLSVHSCTVAMVGCSPTISFHPGSPTCPGQSPPPPSSQTSPHVGLPGQDRQRHVTTSPPFLQYRNENPSIFLNMFPAPLFGFRTSLLPLASWESHYPSRDDILNRRGGSELNTRIDTPPSEAFRSPIPGASPASSPPPLHANQPGIPPPPVPGLPAPPAMLETAFQVPIPTVPPLPSFVPPSHLLSDTLFHDFCESELLSISTSSRILWPQGGNP